MTDAGFGSKPMKRSVRIMKDMVRVKVEDKPFSNWGYMVECSDDTGSERLQIRQTQIWTTKLDEGYVTACLRTPPLKNLESNPSYYLMGFGQIISVRGVNENPRGIDKLMRQLATQEAYTWLHELPTYDAVDLTGDKPVKLSI